MTPGSWVGSLPVHRGDGRDATVDAVIVGGADACGEIDWVAILAVDDTEQRQREADLAHRASHDPLTGLPNRTLAMDRLEVAMAVSQRTGAPLAVIALDLDGFKRINDDHGHAAGDLVLQQVTARLAAAVRPADTVARFGGDEFVIVVHPPEHGPVALLVAQRIRHQLASPSYAVGDDTVQLTASIGLAVADPGQAQTVEELLATADRGMYRAKRAGGDRIRFAAAGSEAEPGEVDAMVADLATALRAGQIRVAFDPVVDIESGDPVALEILTRWLHPGRGLLSEDDFRRDAATTGYLDQVSWAAAERGIELARTHAVRIPVQVPLSASQLADDDAVERIEALRDTARGVVVRVVVSEQALSELRGTGLGTIERLHERGVGIVLSRHGRGGLPLALLASLPLAAVALDPSIARAARAQPNAVALATQLASNHRVPCIATEVDRPSDRNVLAVLGVTAVQGSVTGGEWDEARLAGSIIPPRP